jgi:hypothetical protein
MFLLSSWNPSVKENINLPQSSPYFRSSISSIPNFCPTKSSHFCHGTRPQAVEALSWAELAEVALAYASLRLYSQSLFGAGAHFWCWCGRICQERGEHCLKLHSFFLTSVFFLAKILRRSSQMLGCWTSQTSHKCRWVNINELMQLMLMKSAGFAKSALVQPQPEARTLAAEGVEASFRAHFLGFRFVKIMVDQNVYD